MTSALAAKRPSLAKKRIGRNNNILRCEHCGWKANMSRMRSEEIEERIHEKHCYSCDKRRMVVIRKN